MIRFKDSFLFINGVGFSILTFFTTSLLPDFMFGVCFGGLILNYIYRIKDRKNG